MTALLTESEFENIRKGYDPIAEKFWPLNAAACCDRKFADVERTGIFHESWQFLCRSEKLRNPGDIGALTFTHRLTCSIKANWKAAGDNFLECYHCPAAHRDFVSLVDMQACTVKIHGIYSSHIAPGRVGRKLGLCDG